MNPKFEQEPIVPFLPAHEISEVAGNQLTPGEYLERRIDTFYGVAYKVAEGDKEKADELFQEICVRALGVLSDPELIRAHRDIGLLNFTARLAHKVESEESETESLEAFYDENPGITHNMTDQVIRRLDNEIFVRHLPNLLSERDLSMLIGHVLEGRTRAELGEQHEISAEWVGETVKKSLHRIKTSRLGIPWERTTNDH